MKNNAHIMTSQTWIRNWVCPSLPIGLCALAFMLIHSLTGPGFVQAGGFNVNSLVTFAPIASTYRTVTNTAGCPAGFVGKFTFTARLTNKSSSPAMPGLDVIVQTLTNGNVLLDSQTKQILGGTGAVMEIPQVGQYGDGLLSASDAVDVPFIICLKTRQSFQFFVDVFGIVTKLVSINRAGTDSGNHQSGGGPPVKLSADGRFMVFESRASDLVPNDTNDTTDVFVRDLQTGVTTLVSVNRTGTDSGNSESYLAGLSADGRLVMFSSAASDLVSNDTNGAGDVFVRDLQTNVTKLVSINRTGTDSGNGESFPGAAFSADGRLITFQSAASDLVATDTNGASDGFVRDLQTGVTTLVSVNRTGTDSGNGDSGGGVLSANGRFVAFGSIASDLVATDTNEAGDVFVRDLQTGVTKLVSINRAGTDSGRNNNGFFHSSGSTISDISANGRFVVFGSGADDLVATDNNGGDRSHYLDVFVRDMQTGTTSLVSVNRLGTDSGYGPFESNSYQGKISADGRFVVFGSGACDLVAITEQDCGEVDKYDVFVRDLQTGTTTLVNVNQAGTRRIIDESWLNAISVSGRFVAFSNNNAFDPFSHAVFVRDLQTGVTKLVSINRTGTVNGNGSSFTAVLSADGRFVAFTSEASDLVSTDTNGTTDVFVRPVQ